MSSLTPQQIVQELDKHIVGQTQAAPCGSPVTATASARTTSNAGVAGAPVPGHNATAKPPSARNSQVSGEAANARFMPAAPRATTGREGRAPAAAPP